MKMQDVEEAEDTKGVYPIGSKAPIAPHEPLYTAAVAMGSALGCDVRRHTSQLYQDELARHGMQASMSRRGSWDNAVAESFFSTLKCQIGVLRRYACIADARHVLFEYIEVFYNRQRLHSSNGYRSPAAAEAEAA
ncbi:integrase core domain-containing protein [Dyella sp. Tek66A03]|uniref:integrase core domain-containing protein n=1 Tax=Dyella sp. Tek66A03 TaxID=3458298 RepID=UPI00403E5653